MKKTARLAGLLAFAFSAASSAAPVINSVLTSYSSTGVPTSVTIFGTGLCAANTCTAKPAVTLGGTALTPVSGTVTGITAPLGVIADGDYVLKLTTTGTTSTSYNLTIRAKVAGTPGPQGPAGPAGPAGAQGPMGLQGPAGNNGADGARGPAGVAGAAGTAGATGPAGPQGLQGLKGDKGEKGDNGAQGAPGPDGVPGEVPSATTFGGMLYWNTTGWVEIPPPATDGKVLRFCDGAPTWRDSCVIIPPPPPSPNYLFAENFLDGSYDTSIFEAPTGMFELQADGLHRTVATQSQSRQYLRTINADYLNKDFIFEVKFTVNSVPFDIAFIGFGEAVVDPGYYNEPKNSATFRIHRGTSGVGRVDVAVHTAGYEAFTYWALPGSLPATTLPAQYTARITKIGNRADFSISGGGGTITGSVADIAALAPFLTASNTRLFMGNNYGSMAYTSATLSKP